MTFFPQICIIMWCAIKGLQYTLVVALFVKFQNICIKHQISHETEGACL